MKHRISLWASLSLTLMTIIALSTAIFYAIMIHETYQAIKNQEMHLLTSTGKMLSQNQDIIEALDAKNTTPKIISYTNTIASSYHLDYIVVMDMNGIRFTHPNPQKIGQPFQGGDEKNVLAGKEVVSTAKGSLGKSLRYFVPVYSHDKKQIGAIAVGIKLTTLNEVLTQSKQKYTSALLLCSLISLLFISLIALRLKKQLHNLEPSEVFQLLEERNAMLDQIENAVFIINQNDDIVLVNPAAEKLLANRCEPMQLKGKKMAHYFPNFSRIDFKQSHEQLFRFEEEDYLMTVSPIQVKGHLRGHIIFIRKAADALYTMDQLMYTTTYASALQAQTHKFMNHLHVIYGLVDIAYYDQLKIYLDSILEPDSEIITSLSVLIKEPLLASFLIGEQDKYRELNTHLRFDITSDIPACQSKNQLNNCLMIYRYLHTNFLMGEKTKEVKLGIRFDKDQLTSLYQISNDALSSEEGTTILSDPYFEQLLSDTHSKYQNHSSKEEFTFSVMVPYRRKI